GVAGPTSLEQQHLVAWVCRQPVRDGRPGRTGADNNVVVGLHVPLPALSLDAFYSGTMPRGDQARQCLPPTYASSSLRSCSGVRSAVPAEMYAPVPGNDRNGARLCGNGTRLRCPGGFRVERYCFRILKLGGF